MSDAKRRPGVFDSELGELESRLMLASAETAVKWAQGSSIWPDTFGHACRAIEIARAQVGDRHGCLCELSRRSTSTAGLSPAPREPHERIVTVQEKIEAGVLDADELRKVAA